MREYPKMTGLEPKVGIQLAIEEDGERDRIGVEFNIWGDARKRMIKTQTGWYLDGIPVKEHQDMLNNIYEKDTKNPHNN